MERLDSPASYLTCMLVDLMHLVKTLMHWFCRSDANTTSFGAERIKIASASMTTESSIAADCAAAASVVDSVLALASDRTVANALWNQWSANKLSSERGGKFTIKLKVI